MVNPGPKTGSQFAGVFGDDQIRVLEHLPCGPRECEGGFCWDGGLVREMMGEIR